MSDSKQRQQIQSQIDSFVAKAGPLVTFDSERGSEQSELCRRTPQGRDCTRVFLSSTKLLSELQNRGFLCMASPDPSRTEIECQRAVSAGVALTEA